MPGLMRSAPPWRSNRQPFEGILWFFRSGAGWPDLPDRYPSPSACWPRWRRWEKDRTQLRVWHRLVEGKKPLATVVSQRLKKGGCSRPGPKLMVVADGQAILLGDYLCLASAAEVTLVEATLAWLEPMWPRSAFDCWHQPMTVNPDLNDRPINTLSWW